MLYTFPSAEIVVGVNGCQRFGTACDCSLNVNIAQPDAVINVSVPSPFLNGTYKITGEFSEKCRPNSSILKRGVVAGLQLSSEREWSIAKILPVDLLDVVYVDKSTRLYRWAYFVVGS